MGPVAGVVMPGRPGVLVLNFGGPRSADELAPFLTNLFDDVLPLPWPLRRPAAWVLARGRAPRVQPAYEAIGWSPVVETTERQAAAMRDALVARGIDAPPMATGMLFTTPTVESGLAKLREAGVDRYVAIALFPQYSLTTTAAAFSRVDRALAAARDERPVTKIAQFHDHPRYVEAVAATVRRAAAALAGEGPIHLLFSPHGLPMSYVRKGDPYPDQVRRTVELVVAALGWTDPHHVGWQSRVGPVAWLAPSTLEVVDRLASEGAKRVLVVPISFVGEHIETRWELDVEVAGHARAKGISHFGRAEAVGLEPAFVDALADVVAREL